MARVAGVRLVGMERSAEQLAGAVRDPVLLDLRQGDVLQPPLRDEEWGSFDVAHARFILEHVDDPLRVVKAMLRAVRPGGRVVLADDDHGVDRKSTRLNSSHSQISYAVFCLKKKNSECVRRSTVSVA